jgi:hypothetical protein
MSDVDLVRTDERPDTEIDCLLLTVLRDHVRLFGAELDLRDVAQAHDGAVPFRHDEGLELLGRTQIGVGEQVDLNELVFRASDGGEVVVALERRVHIARREPERCETIGIDPDAHRQLLPAFERDALHARQGRELWLQRPQEPVGDLRGVASVGGEAQIKRRVRTIGALDLDDGR